METIFKYKQQFFLRFWLVLVIGSFPLMLRNLELYFNILYCSILILTQGIVHIYYASKRLIVSEQGIQQKILWNMIFRNVSWEQIEEAHETVSNGSGTRSPSAWMESFSIQRWLAEKSMGRTIKIIICYEEPICLDLNEIKNSSQLYQLLKERIRFVRL